MRGRLLLAVVALWVCLDPGEGLCHSRTRRTPPPLPAAVVPASPPPAAVKAAAPAPLRWEDAFREVNVRSGTREKAPLLLTAARLARQQGDLPQARWAYRLLMQLQPKGETAVAARQERLVLDFYQELAELPKLAACRRFFLQLLEHGELSQGSAVRLALREAWQTLEQELPGEGPLPPAVAEQLLELWELTPVGLRPPEAKLLLARLFKERGLPEEARQLLEQVAASGEEHLRREALARLLEIAWADQGLGGFLAMLAHLQTTYSGAVEALRARPLSLEGSPVPDTPPPTGMALPPTLRLKLWEALSRQPLPGALTLHLLQDLAEMHRAGVEAPHVAALYHALLEGARERLGAGFYYDRVGVEHLRQGQWLAAQEAFQAQAQDEDPLWQQLGRVRLLEVELAQTKAGGSR